MMTLEKVDVLLLSLRFIITRIKLIDVVHARNSLQGSFCFKLNFQLAS